MSQASMRAKSHSSTASTDSDSGSFVLVTPPQAAMSQYTIHSSILFDPKKKEFVKDVSVTVDTESGLITKVFTRDTLLEVVPEGDVDLRGKIVMPGFVDAHTHIFLHSYE